MEKGNSNYLSNETSFNLNDNNSLVFKQEEIENKSYRIL